MNSTCVTKRERDSAVSEPVAAPTVRETSALGRIGIGLLVTLALLVLVAVDSAWPAGFVLAAVGAAAVALAMDEFAELVRRIGVTASRSGFILAGVALFLLHWAGSASPAIPAPWLLAAVVLCGATITCLSARVVTGSIAGALTEAGAIAVALVYVPLLLAFLTGIRLRWGVAGLLTVLVVCKGGSSGAYFFGKTFGRSKLAPRVSPNKTVAGAVGQLLVSAGLACALSYSPWSLMRPAVAVLFGLVTACAAMFGDLAESLLKREAGVKDSGRRLPGLGGMLDMIDDLLFAAPVSYFFLLLCR